MPDYSNLDRGILFQNNRRMSDKAPDWTGNIELSKELLTFLVGEARAGRPIKMDVAGWNKTGRNGSQFMSMSVKKPYQPAQTPAQPQPDQEGF